MSGSVPINSSRLTHTYAAGELNDADGIMTSAATVASPVSLSASDYDGADVAGSGTRWAKFPRTVTITRASNASSYTTDPIVLTGTWNGVAVTESLTPADADGGDALRGSQPFDFPPLIAIPAQADTSGAFTIGGGDICAPAADKTFHSVTLRADGTINVEYLGGSTDAWTQTAQVLQAIAPTKILTSQSLTAPTSVELTVGLG